VRSGPADPCLSGPSRSSALGKDRSPGANVEPLEAHACRLAATANETKALGSEWRSSRLTSCEVDVDQSTAHIQTVPRVRQALSDSAGTRRFPPGLKQINPDSVRVLHEGLVPACPLPNLHRAHRDFDPSPLEFSDSYDKVVAFKRQVIAVFPVRIWSPEPVPFRIPVELQKLRRPWAAEGNDLAIGRRGWLERLDHLHSQDLGIETK
jgi:hypothetical protein